MNPYQNPRRKSHPSVKYQRKRMKKRPHLAVLFILLCIIVWFAITLLASDSEQNEYSPSPYQTPASYHPPMPHQTPMPYQAYSQIFTFEHLARISNDYLLLVNIDYAVPDHVAGNLVRISDYVNTLNPEMLLNEDTLVMLRAMFDSAANIGFTQFRATQGFRTHEYQQELYNTMADTGLAAPPGHSEHQLGFAVDISYHGVNIGNSAQGSWLMDYSYRYGFILRYPEHKTHITNVPFEPWHYRYVGQPHAYFMTHNDLVLEEYIDYLRRNREITVIFDGAEFTIFYVTVEDEVLELPYGYSFWASHDNTGGIIVTAWRT